MYHRRHNVRSVCLALISVAAFGCAPALEDGFEDELTIKGGCADVMFYAVDEADEVMLSFVTDGLLEVAHEADEETVTEFEIPSNEVTLVVEVGRNVSDAMCDDVIENEGPIAVRSYTAISGTARVTAWPGEEEDYTGASGDLLLENVEFKSNTAGAKNITVETLEITDAEVGWFAG